MPSHSCQGPRFGGWGTDYPMEGGDFLGWLSILSVPWRVAASLCPVPLPLCLYWSSISFRDTCHWI